jgi:hypothetical protein
MSRSRHLAAVLVVTAALCVDGVTAPVSAAAPQVVQLACRLATRLSIGFRQSVPTTSVHLARHRIAAQPIPIVVPALLPETPVHACAFSPLQFRLPPPSFA